MKRIIIVTLITLAGCSKPFNKKDLNGFWQFGYLCKNGEIIQNSTVFKIKNDTLFNLSPDNINCDKIWLELTQDSITINRQCFIDRGKYIFDGNRIRLIGRKHDLIWTRIPNHQLTAQDYFNQENIQLVLPNFSGEIDHHFSDTRLLYIGEPYYQENENCFTKDVKLDLELNLTIDSAIQDTLNNPFEIEKGNKMKYGARFIEPKDLNDLKNSLESECRKNEKLSIVFFGDSSISLTTMNNIISELDSPYFNFYRAGIKKNGTPTEFVYRKIN